MSRPDAIGPADDREPAGPVPAPQEASAARKGRRRLLPEHWRLADLARELGTTTHALVQASRRGEFVPVVQIGRCWFARADLVRAWFNRQHANDNVPTALQRDLILQAGAEGAEAYRRERERIARIRQAGKDSVARSRGLRKGQTFAPSATATTAEDPRHST